MMPVRGEKVWLVFPDGVHGATVLQTTASKIIAVRMSSTFALDLAEEGLTWCRDDEEAKRALAVTRSL